VRAKRAPKRFNRFGRVGLGFTTTVAQRFQHRIGMIAQPVTHAPVFDT